METTALPSTEAFCWRPELQVIQLQCMADDCQNWKSADMVEARRGMEVSLLKYRLAKELGQESRHMLDDMLDVSAELIGNIPVQIFE